jgi:hypothetical protein
MGSPYDDSIEEFKKREQVITAEISRLQLKLRKIRNARIALQAFLIDGKKEGTYVLTRKYVQTLPPDTVVDISKLIEYAISQGWDAVMDERRHAMLMALSNVARQGIITKQKRGIYRTWPESHMKRKR